MEYISLQGFIFLMLVLIPLAVYMGVTENRRRKEDPHEHVIWPR